MTPIPRSPSPNYYFSLCETVARLRARITADSLIEFRHEDFIADPRALLSKLCGFLNVEAGGEYLRDCSSIVRAEPNRTRFERPWSRTAIARVEGRASRFSFLQGYSYAGD